MRQAVNILIALVIVGVLLWLVETWVPMDPFIRSIIRVAVIVVLVIAALKWGRDQLTE